MIKKALQAVCFCGFFANFAAIPTACAAPSIPKSLQQKSLVYCTNVSGFSFNPQKADLGSNMNVVTEQIYDKLIEFDAEQNRLKPSLAERFEVSQDGLEITFYLRKNVHFHHTAWFKPTRPFNAEDVLFSLNRVIGNQSADLPELNREQTGENYRRHSALARQLADRTHFPFFESIDLKSKISQILAPQSNVVKIRLNRPDSSFLAHLSSRFAVILSKEYALQLNAAANMPQLDLLPVGTGVYQLDSYVQNDYVRLKPNPKYWGKAAKISNMIVDFSSNGTGRMAKFLNGECDISAFPEPSQTSIVKSNQGYLVEQQGANLAYLAFNFDRPIAHDIILRKKIAQSINRQRIADRLFYTMAEIPQQVLPNVLNSEKNRVNNVENYPYTAPNEVLKSTTNELLLWVIDEKQVYNLHPLKMAEMIKADLAKAGISLNIRAVSRAFLTQQLEEGKADYDLILSGWLANNFEPDSFLSPILACQAKNSVTNLANWCSDEFDELLKKARLSEDNALQDLLYQQAQRVLHEQLPLLPLVNVKRVLLVDNSVSNVKLSPFGQVKLSQVKVK